jgi:hypothetical protein
MRHGLPALALLLIAACSSSSAAALTAQSASVDPTYYCPGGANNAPYELHATVRLHNGTAKAVTIDSVTAEMTLVSVKGAWLEKVGDRYEAGDARFAPSTVAAGGNATLNVKIPSACSSGKYGTGTSSSADYTVTIHLATTAGKLTVTSDNRHQIIAD